MQPSQDLVYRFVSLSPMAIEEQFEGRYSLTSVCICDARTNERDLPSRRSYLLSPYCCSDNGFLLFLQPPNCFPSLLSSSATICNDDIIM